MKTGTEVVRHPKFAKIPLETEFFDTLKERVYLDIGPENIYGNTATFVKAIFFIGSYLALVGIALGTKLPPMLMFLDAIGIGLLAPCIGFCVMHDAIHGTISKNKDVNRWFGYTLDMMSCSSYIWYIKHNIIHHTYPNVHLYDDDIDIMLMRVHADQKWKPIHKYQHLYWPLLYSLTYFAWVYYMDYQKLNTGKIGESPRKPLDLSGDEHRDERGVFIRGKFFHFMAVLVVPCITQGWLWLLAYATLMLITGFAIAIVFQLAHLVEKVSLVPLPESPNDFESTFRVHQIDTTADFDPENKVTTFFVGGLNFQVEHHLFPEINSRHYPRIRLIVMATCAKYGIPYHCFDTIPDGIRSHVRLLEYFGRKPEEN